MDLLLQNTFARLLSRYERTFGEPLPFSTATAEEVVDDMRRRLNKGEAVQSLLPKVVERTRMERFAAL